VKRDKKRYEYVSSSRARGSAYPSRGCQVV
jgi:hypothetical protein